MVKILHIVSSWGVGGVESYIFNFAKHIKKYEFDILTLRKTENKTIFNLSGTSQIYNLSKVEGNYFKRTKKRKDEIIEFILKHKYEVVHIDTTTADMLIIAKEIKKRTNVKIIYHSHATDVEAPNVFLKRVLHYYSKRLYYSNVDYYIAASKDAAIWMYPKKILKNNCHIITCGADLEKFRFNYDDRIDIRNKFNLEKKIVIGTVGRFSNQKNIPFIINLIELMAKKKIDFNFLWIGNGHLFEDTKEEVKKRKLDKYVIFTGNIKEVEKLYSAMDIFILPSFYEANPIVAIEAQANGLKCSLSDTITKESNVSNTVSYISCKNIDLWMAEILKNREYVRKDNIEIIIKRGASVKENSIKLLEIYDKVFMEE